MGLRRPQPPAPRETACQLPPVGLQTTKTKNPVPGDEGWFGFYEPDGSCAASERRGLREGGWRFPWGGLCLKFNMLFLSLSTPGRAPSCFVILAPLSVWWMRSLICWVLPLFPEWPLPTHPQSVTWCYRSHSATLNSSGTCDFAP